MSTLTADPDRPTVRVGVTGHINITPGSFPVLYDALVEVLCRITDREVHGVTCLACGADQLFARAVLATRGTYEVILPAPDYRERVIGSEHREGFDELLRRASDVSYTDCEVSGRRAYRAASREMLRRVDRLVAVWDGTPKGCPGGTAEVVQEARRLGLPTTVVWPEGAHRSR